MSNARSKSYDLIGSVVAGKIIEAAETEDVLGCVLRMHLVSEYFLASFIDCSASKDMKSFLGSSKYFSDKLRIAVALGLPIPFANVLRQINKMRNQLAHEELTGTVSEVDVQTLGRLTEALVSVDPNFRSLGSRFLEVPVARPGVRMTFGQGDKRVDFLISTTAFFACATQWLHAKADGAFV